MSNIQANNGHRFRILPEVQHEQFRLLELPPDVLDLIQKHDSPVIQLKAREASNTNAKDTNAVLCMPEKSYQIRQVNHSNSVYITRPGEICNESDGSSNYAVEAFATNNFILELIPVPKESAVDDLRSLLPIYTSTGNYDSKDLRVKQSIIDNVPASQAECDRAWKQLACFELTDPIGCFRPSASVRMKVWLAMLNLAEAEGLDITGPLSRDMIDQLIAANEDFPVELSQAVLNAMLEENGTAIEPERCVHFVGSSHLEERTRTAGETSVEGFLASWADSMPEKWRAHVNVELIRDVCQISDSGKDISFIDETTKKDSNASDAPGAKVSLGAKRKWHEKFRASKRTT